MKEEQKETSVYYKSWSSPKGIQSLIFGSMFSVFGILFISNPLKSIICFGLAFLIIQQLVFLPRKITINEEWVSIGENRFGWDEVKKVFFRIKAVRDATAQVIEIHLHNRVLSIKPRYYGEYTKLRKVFEEIVDKKSIEKQVGDRGV